MFSDVISLLSYTKGKNAIGDSTKTPSSRQVFANKKSIRQSEFYQAAASGLRPELMFEIRIADYQGEAGLEHKGKTYKIIRTYEKDREFLELVCQGAVNGVM